MSTSTGPRSCVPPLVPAMLCQRDGVQSDGRLEAALEQTSVSEALRVRGECACGTAPQELVHIAEESRIGPQRCQILEQERLIAAVRQYVRREALDGTMSVQEPCRGDRTDPRNAGIPVCGVADQGEKVRNQDRRHSELLANSFGIEDLLPPAVYLHDSVAADTLRQVLIR